MKFVAFVVLFGLLASLVQAKTHYYDFIVKEASYTRLCLTKNILTVNGEFPGPTINARKGDTVIVRVYNQGNYNLTIHWHGVDQPRNPWHDGPEYITQCPIKPGANFTYTILFSEEEGTLWWHAHSDWSRATVHGAIIIHPKIGTAFPFPKPHKEIPIILGEWWNDNIKQISDGVLRTGGPESLSDAFSINGQPGDFYPCSKKDTFTVKVKHGETYLLRVINAALNSELFFAVGGHKLTVVGKDASYTKPSTKDYIMITPGQTMDILLEAKPIVQNTSIDRYYMAARAYRSTDASIVIKFPNTTTTAVLRYINNAAAAITTPMLPTLPDFNDTTAAERFASGLRSLATNNHPIHVPKSIDERIKIAIAVNLFSNGPSDIRPGASLNNISFIRPSIDNILQAYHENTNGVFGTEFPNRPPTDYNFTGKGFPINSLASKVGTQVRVLEYGTNVEVVLQGTNLITGENHPIHLHGYSFYVVGRGFGNFDEEKDPLKYNLVDPPLENTVGVPKSGWVAIRFKAINPGVWFMHCHLELHATWGMDTVFIVKNGATAEAQMLPSPLDMPPC